MTRYSEVRHAKSMPGLFILFFMVLLFGCTAVTPPAVEKEVAEVDRAAVAREAAFRAFDLGDYTSALAGFREAYSIDRRAGRTPDQALDLLLSGRTLVRLGRFRQAESFLGSAMKFYFSLRDEAGLADVYATLAQAELGEGSIRQAGRDLDEAIAIDRRLGRPLGSRLNLRGLIYVKEGRPTEARRVLLEALELNNKKPSEAAHSLRLLAGLARKAGDAQKALGYYRKAYGLDRAAGEPLAVALDLRGMASIEMERERFDEALLFLKKSYMAHIGEGMPDEAAKDLDAMVRAYRAMGDEQKAQYYSAVRQGMIADRKADETEDTHSR